MVFNTRTQMLKSPTYVPLHLLSVHQRQLRPRRGRPPKIPPTASPSSANDAMTPPPRSSSRLNKPTGVAVTNTRDDRTLSTTVTQWPTIAIQHIWRCTHTIQFIVGASKMPASSINYHGMSCTVPCTVIAYTPLIQVDPRGYIQHSVDLLEFSPFYTEDCKSLTIS